MKLGFNTNEKTTTSVLVGRLGNSIASTSRIFKYYNKKYLDLNISFNHIFNNLGIPSIQPQSQIFTPYHILNNNQLSINEIPNELQNSNITPINPINSNKLLKAIKPILTGPFSPSQIKTAYSINSITPLKGIRPVIITIITAFNNPYLVNDVKAFGNLFGLPPCNLKIYNFSPYFVPNWAVETTLDVQWAYAINPYAEIRVIQARTSNWADLFNAINFANNKNNFSPAINTDIINMSWGTPDKGNFSAYNNYFNNTNTIYVASSGDNSVVSFPSACTNILAIGGTSLNLLSNYTRSTEKVWSRSGCGLSSSFNKPIYQPNINNNTRRITPDCCCVADPSTGCYVVLNSKLYSIGGTSLSAPIYAGMLSILTQNRLNQQKSTFTSVAEKINSIQPILYKNTTSFFDVISGSSSSYTAKQNFDIASGLGVCNLNSIIQQIN